MCCYIVQLRNFLLIAVITNMKYFGNDLRSIPAAPTYGLSFLMLKQTSFTTHHQLNSLCDIKINYHLTLTALNLLNCEYKNIVCFQPLHASIHREGFTFTVTDFILIFPIFFGVQFFIFFIVNCGWGVDLNMGILYQVTYRTSSSIHFLIKSGWFFTKLE